MQLLDKLNKELGLTVVMVIHDLNHAIQYADYVAVIKAGRLVVSGEPKEIVTSKLLADVFRVQADEFACSNSLSLKPCLRHGAYSTTNSRKHCACGSFLFLQYGYGKIFISFLPKFLIDDILIIP